MSETAAKAALDRLYAELPTVDCQRKCPSSCGPIAMTRIEWGRIVKRLGYEPRATSITCPMLQGGLCSVYQLRPMICRLWGAIEPMRCPWGCEASPRPLTHREAMIFLMRAEEIGTPENAEGAGRMVAELETMRDDDPRLRLSSMFVVTPTKEGDG